jgi:hypothetical protein
MDINGAYNAIKNRLQNLAAPKIEAFTLQPYADLPISEEEKEMMQALGVDQKEVYDVIDKFDLPPTQLSPLEKQLRKKYLELILKFLNSEADNFKKQVEGSGMVDANMMSNYDASVVLSKRVVNLLIQEISPVECPKCKDCPECSKTLEHSIIGILIVVLIGLFVYMAVRV